jgi:predicted Zn-dependent protease
MERDLAAAHGWARRATQQNPNYLPAWRVLAAVTGHLGLAEAATEAVARMLAIVPNYSMAFDQGRHLNTAPQAWDFFFEGLRRAGAPESR